MIQGKCAERPGTPCGYDEPLCRECRRERAAATDENTGRRIRPISWSADGKTIRFGRYLVQADGSGQTAA